MIEKKIMQINMHTWPPENRSANNVQCCENDHTPANGKSLLLKLKTNRNIKTAYSSIFQKKPLEKLITSVTGKISLMSSSPDAFAENDGAAFNIVKKNIVFWAGVINKVEFHRLQPNTIGVCL